MTKQQQQKTTTSNEQAIMVGKPYQDSLGGEALNLYLAELQRQAAQGIVCESIPYSLDDSSIMDVITAQNQGLISAEQCAAFCAADAARKAQLASKPKPSAGSAPYFSIGEKGGVTLNRLWDKKTGFPPSYKPVQFAALASAICSFAQHYVDEADTVIKPDAVKQQRRKDGPGLEDRPHERRGLSAIDFAGVDRAEFIAMCKKLASGELPEQVEIG